MLRSRYQSWLLPYLEGSLDPEKKLLLEAQLARDPALMAEAETLRHTVTALRDSAADLEPLPTSGFSVWPGVQARIQNQPQRSFGRGWAWGGVGVVAAAVGLLMVTLSNHPTQIPKHSPVNIAVNPAAPPTTQSTRVASAKEMSSPTATITNSTVNSAKQKVDAKVGPVLAQAPAIVVPTLPIPVNGKNKGTYDPFRLPGQKSHPTLMAQVPKSELRDQLYASSPLPPMPVIASPTVAEQKDPKSFASTHQDKDGVLPTPREFGPNRADTHKDIVPGAPSGGGGFGGGAGTAGAQPNTSSEPSMGGLDAPATQSTDNTTVQPAPNKITLPAPAASPTPLGRTEQRSAAGMAMKSSPNSAPFTAPLFGNMPSMADNQGDSEVLFKSNVNGGLPTIESRLKNSVSAPEYGTAEAEKRMTQLFESVRASGGISVLRRNLLQERKRHPEDLESSRLLAAFYAFQSEPDAALSERKRIVGLNGTEAEDWYQLAVAAQHKSDIATARNAYFQVLQIGGLNNSDHYDQARQFFTSSSNH